MSYTQIVKDQQPKQKIHEPFYGYGMNRNTEEDKIAVASKGEKEAVNIPKL